MGKKPRYPDKHAETKIIDPLLAFRGKVGPLNQIHNDCMQAFTTTIMGLLTGSDGGVEFQGPGANALGEMVGQFLDIERQLAGADPFTLEGRLQDAAVIGERYAQDLLATLNGRSLGQTSTRPKTSMFGDLLDGGDGDNEDEGDPNEAAAGFLGEYQVDMRVPTNEPLPDPPDINAGTSSGSSSSSQGSNAGFIKTLGIEDDGGEGGNRNGFDRSITNTSQLNPNLPAQLNDGGTIESGGRSGGDRPLNGPPNSYVTTSGGHVLIYDEQGRLIFDIDSSRIKMTVWDQAPNGRFYPRDIKLDGPVPPEYRALLP